MNKLLLLGLGAGVLYFATKKRTNTYAPLRLPNSAAPWGNDVDPVQLNAAQSECGPLNSLNWPCYEKYLGPPMGY